jgi:tetratricopeptide (TPR) repeat protein
MLKRALLSIAIVVSLPATGLSQRRPSTTNSAPTPTSVEGDILGQVAMPDDTSRAGLEVTLETSDHIRSQTMLTDEDGRFQFRRLTVDTYYIYINIEGFSPIEQQVVLKATGPTASAMVLLEMRHGSSDPDAKTPAGSADRRKDDKGANTFAADLLMKYPAKAVKEYQQGLDEQTKGNTDKALSHFEKATSEAPQFYEAWLEVGKTRQQLGHLDPADQAFRRARKLQPQSALPLIDLGGVELDRARKMESAGSGTEAMSLYRDSLKLFEEASKLSPASQQLEYFKGSAQFKIGDLNGAESSLKAALDGARPFEDARLMLVNVLMKQRRYPEALEQLSAYLDANPNSPQRPAIEKMQSQIRTLPLFFED